jgi:hypothetical protein
MKKMLTTTALTLALALSAGVSAASAKTKGKKHTPEHAAAIKKCGEAYSAALKEARTKKGNERKTAEQAARSSRKQCVAGAPM